MKRLYPILFCALVVLLVSACDPFQAEQIKRQAEADAIRMQSEQTAMSEEQQRTFAQDQHFYAMADAERLKVIKDSAVETAKQAANLMVRLAGFVLVVSVCTLMLGTTLTVNNTVKGVGLAMVRAADVRANLIRRDPVTGLFPGFLYYDGKGKYRALSFDTHAVLELDTRNDADRQLIANMGAVQVVNALATHASKSDDPAGVSIIKAPTIDVTNEMISLARELTRRDDE